MKTSYCLVLLSVVVSFAAPAFGWDFEYDGDVDPHHLVNASPEWEYGDSPSSWQGYDTIRSSADAETGGHILDRNDDNSGSQSRFYGLRFALGACNSEWPWTHRATLVIRARNLETNYTGNPDGNINTEGKALLDIRDATSDRWALSQTEENQWVLDCYNDRAHGRTDVQPMLVDEGNGWDVFRILINSDGASTTYATYRNENPTPLHIVTHAETISTLRFELALSSGSYKQRWQIDWIRVEVGEVWLPGEGHPIPRNPVTWHVAPPPLGSDENPGTHAHPFATIQRSINASFDGDIIVVAEGTYLENIRFHGKNIVLRSTDPFDPGVVENTIIDGNRSGSVVTFEGTENETCVLSGFTIRNGCGYDGGGICGGDWELQTGATIKDNVITGNCGAEHGGGLAYCGGTIHNNIIFRNSGNNEGGGLAYCRGTIRNNTIVGNSGGGASCSGTVVNCIVWGNVPYQVGGVCVPAYCCIQDWGGGGEGNISADPEFVDGENGNFRLSPSSPCIDAGDNTSPNFPDTDIRGMHRIMYGGKSLTVDMGAYEYYINRIEADASGDATLAWSSVANKAYSIYYSGDMRIWQLADSNVPSAGDSVTEWCDPSDALSSREVRRRYYRVMENEVQPLLDISGTYTVIPETFGFTAFTIHQNGTFLTATDHGGGTWSGTISNITCVETSSPGGETLITWWADLKFTGKSAVDDDLSLTGTVELSVSAASNVCIITADYQNLSTGRIGKMVLTQVSAAPWLSHLASPGESADDGVSHHVFRVLVRRKSDVLILAEADITRGDVLVIQ